VRVLYGSYTGPLYQVCAGSASPGPNSCSGGTTLDIGSVAGGYANSAAQDAFCSGGCTISKIYDQSPSHNDLEPTPSGGGAKASADNPATANSLPTTLNGHKVYGILVTPGIGYRAGCTGCGVATAVGTATGDSPETIYMVSSKNNLINNCCFDYGNAETDLHDDGAGTMECVYLGGGANNGTGFPGAPDYNCSAGMCTGNGPWAMSDLENGIYAGWQNNQDQDISTNMPLLFDFVTAMVVGDVSSQNGGQGRFALYGGDATNGPLTTEWDGIRPAKGGYNPMAKQGSIILGTGGDNSDGGGGNWFEGVMTGTVASLTTLNAVQANIVAAGYGK
jgi:non-reducing end alpha-L-arabinofuranosidase